MLEDAHLAELGDICFHKGKLLSVADDGVLKVFNVKGDGAVGQAEIQLETRIELS